MSIPNLARNERTVKSLLNLFCHVSNLKVYRHVLSLTLLLMTNRNDFTLREALFSKCCGHACQIKTFFEKFFKLDLLFCKTKRIDSISMPFRLGEK